MEVKLARGETVSSVYFFYATDYQFFETPREDFLKIGACAGELLYDGEERGYQVVLRINNNVTMNELWTMVDSSLKILIAYEESAEKLMRFIQANNLIANKQ